MRRTIAAVLTSLVALSACGAPAPANVNDIKPEPKPTAGSPRPGRLPEASVVVVPLPDGREVMCVWAEMSNAVAASLQCDWESARRGISEESK